ncbi:hypothetical protein [Clavibacter michiganensis]|nr:hypothetical protein [Clavibacter michiganensis]MBF4639338.1 hypothetical protein [Clavibacter michiganensis subsp. michiganensis]MDO4033308.1 hypothetical protein [Clavibacter michiganensis]MDO4036501.1 hypothetical protein [Clavibacter michiganensis]MDO4048670.1 hypothetical protein [Clavibacter michiganensis]MDO4051689.1 hypothetical protein [Clavibacter michiganensis]
MVRGEVIGRTITKALTVEARQHELFGIDLGDGFRRREAGLGVLVFLATLPVTYVIANATGFLQKAPQFAVPAMMLPGLVVVMVGFLPSEANPRRVYLTVAALTIRYLLVGHLPIISLGAREPSRLERLSLRDRTLPAIAVVVNRVSQGARQMRTETRAVDFTGPVEPDVPAETFRVRQLGYEATAALLAGLTKKGPRHG